MPRWSRLGDDGGSLYFHVEKVIGGDNRVPTSRPVGPSRQAGLRRSRDDTWGRQLFPDEIVLHFSTSY